MKQYHKNPRQISKKQFADLGESLDELGDLSGVVHDLNSDEIIGGNQRSRVFDVNACQVEIVTQSDQPDEQGTVAQGFVIWKGKRYAYRQVRWTPEQCEEANIKANKAGGDWNWDVIANEWNAADLQGWGFDTETVKQWSGNINGLKELLKSEAPTADAEPQTDRAAELLEKWGVQSGDLWQIGEHRLICGDCTDAATVARVMGGEKADCVIADAPYGMNLNTHYKRGDTGEYNGVTDANRKNYAPVVGDDIDYDPRPVMELFDCKEQFWFGADYYAERIPNKNTGSWMVWDKRAGVEDIKFSLSEFEMIWSKTRRLRQILRVKWFGIQGMEKQDTKERVHPTQKPLELIEILVNLCDGVFVDPYVGSGTTLVACENLRRRCRAIEISPAYVAVALERMSAAFPHLDIHRLDA
jgi:DNA modification methylase